MDYFYPEGCFANAENCFQGTVVKVTDKEGIHVQPFKTATRAVIPAGTCHWLDRTHQIRTTYCPVPNPTVKDYRPIVGEIAGRVENLKQITTQRMSEQIDTNYNALLAEVGDNPLGDILKHPTKKS